jgi:hypothetical protein
MYRPRPGDVLVSRSTARADRYSIWVVDAAAKTVARRFDEAMRTAKQLARQQKVDGWYTCDHTHFLLVALHRSVIETAADGHASEEEGEQRGRLALWS